jgi:hypothetical protein
VEVHRLFGGTHSFLAHSRRLRQSSSQEEAISKLITVIILDITHHSISYLRQDVSKTEFCLRFWWNMLSGPNRGNQRPALGPTEKVPPEEGDRIQSRIGIVLIYHHHKPKQVYLLQGNTVL